MSEYSPDCFKRREWISRLKETLLVMHQFLHVGRGLGLGFTKLYRGEPTFCTALNTAHTGSQAQLALQ
jgi:hypothetical protein